MVAILKSAVTMLVIVALIIVLDCIVSSYISASTDEIMPHIERARQALETGDPPAATAEIEEMKQKWDDCEQYWESFIDHRETENVETLLARLAAMGRAGTPELILPELEELSFFFEHLNDKQKLIFENIF